MKKNYLFFIFLVAILCFAKPAFASLGISPSDWTEPNGLAGQKIQKVFTLSRDDASADLNFAAQITGDINSWVTLENGNSFTMPAGKQQYPVNVILSIPKDAARKEYKEEIRLNSSTKTASTGQVGVLLSALIRIDLTITDKPFLSYSVHQIEVPDQETGKSVNVILKIENDGNVEAKPTKVTADIFDKYNSTKINSFTLTDFSNVAGVGSFSQGNVNLQIPIQLDPEQYWTNISVYQDDKVLKTEDLTFDIVKAGALKKESTLSKAFKNNNLLIIMGTVLIVLIVVIILACILLFRKKTKKNNNQNEESIHIKPHK